MSTATAVNPDRNPGLRVYTLEELVEGARMHGQLLVNAGRALWAAHREAENRGQSMDDPDLIAFTRARASRASEWLWKIEAEGDRAQDAEEAWRALQATGLLDSLPGLVLTAHAAYSDPWGNGHSDVAVMGVQPYTVIVGVGQQVGETLLEWADKHGVEEGDA